jgi:hypothetical protein
MPAQRVKATTMKRDELSDKDLAQRVETLRRFRELLVKQREKFSSYLTVLDHEKNDIESGNVDALVSHVEIEQTIVSEIFTFQKVINPLEDIYREAYHVAQIPSDIPQIQANLEDLRGEVLKRNQENRALLKQKMSILRQEIAGLHNPFKKTKSVYGSTPEPTIIDIRG